MGDAFHQASALHSLLRLVELGRIHTLAEGGERAELREIATRQPLRAVGILTPDSSSQEPAGQFLPSTVQELFSV